MTDNKPEFQEQQGERLRDMFVSEILLRENLDPLIQFINDRKNYTTVDKAEYPILERIVNSVGSPAWILDQCRPTDPPFDILFKGGKTTKNINTVPVITDNAIIVQKLHSNNDRFEPVNLPELVSLSIYFWNSYNEIENAMNPQFKRNWVENKIAEYKKRESEPIEGVSQKVAEEIREKEKATLEKLETYKIKLDQSKDGQILNTKTTPPSYN